ncbi:hypothetical protein ACWDA7_45095 [Streptomyces sp. NPDC001156]
MNPALRIDPADTRGQTAALTVTVELDLHTADVLSHTVAQVLDQQPTVLLELTGVTFSDSWRRRGEARRRQPLDVTRRAVDPSTRPSLPDRRGGRARMTDPGERRAVSALGRGCGG